MDIGTQLEDIQKYPYEILMDKALTTQDFLFKLIIIGDTGVGKSCLMKRVMDNEFKTEHQVTIGVEFGSFGLKVDNKVIKLQIWDTAGQESFRSVTRIFYRGAHCVFLTYDVTREETFVNLVDWLKEIKQHASEDVKVYLIGNKSELEDQREVTLQKAMEFAKVQKLQRVFETSAKTGYNVEEVFSCVAKELYFYAKKEMDRQIEDEVPGSRENEGDKTPQKLKNNRKTPDNSANPTGKSGKTNGKKKKGGCC